MLDTRVTYRRRKSYNTRSNKIKKVKTPGGRLVVHYRKKRTKGPQTQQDCRSKLNGLARMSNSKFAALSHTKRSISRAYGGVLTPCQLKERIKRAFITEEMKIVKRIVSQKK